MYPPGRGTSGGLRLACPMLRTSEIVSVAFDGTGELMVSVSIG